MNCKVCGGDLMELGVLGWLRHFRCRDCGAECSRKIHRAKKIFVGVKVDGTRETFRPQFTPTRASHINYIAVIGPFQTVRGAEYMAKYGKGNPHLQCVADAERIAKGN